MAGGGAGGGGFQIPNFDDFGSFKGGGGSSYIPPGGTGGTPPSGTIFGPAGGGGSPFTGVGPMYDRGVPAFGYRRKPIGPVPNSRTAGAVAAPGGPQSQPYQNSSQGVDYGTTTQQAMAGGSPWFAGGNAPNGFDWTIPQYLQNANAAGVFSPTGSPALLDAISRQYGQAYGSAQRGVRNGLLASGVDDPNAYAYGQLQGDLNAQGQLSGAMDQARLQSMLQNQGFLQNVFGGNQGYAQNQALQGLAERYSHNHNPSAWSQIGSVLGGVAGNAAGAWLAPGGFWGTASGR